MADFPINSLGGKTPLQVAVTLNMDWLASNGNFGLTDTIPAGFPPGSDVGNLSILGYDPKQYFTGRAPLEAASMGVSLDSEDIAFRCNLVTLEKVETSSVMADFAAGHISSGEAEEVILDLDRYIGGNDIQFYPGVSYRHLMVWRRGRDEMVTIPPHDITDKNVESYLPKGDGSTVLLDLMERSKKILENHPVNRRREKMGEKKANAIWLWGQGKAPNLPSIKNRFGLNGGVISAVDLINGLGVYAGLERIPVPGITGYLDTNYKGKAEYALEALKQKDLIFIHVEAPDEAGHMGDAIEKVRAIEAFDELVVGTILKGIYDWEDWRILLLPDHPTPVELKTHVSDPVPFVLYFSKEQNNATQFNFNEIDAKKSGLRVKEAHTLIQGLIEGRRPWIETSL